MYDYQEPPRPKSKTSFGSILLAALIGGIIAAVATCGILFALGKLNIGATQEVVGGKNVTISNVDVDSQVEAVAEVLPESVVSVKTTATETSFFGSTETSGFGSGFIVTSDGYIVTNHHVVGDNPITLKIDLADGGEHEGRVIWSDTSLDMAIVKIDATGLTAVELGDSDSLRIGQVVIAIGNPLGLGFERSVTSGIISALNRSLVIDQSMVAEDLIQTDASINQGNSGGPLLNGQGQVIGINTYKAAQGEGMGFAIPINIVKPILSNIISTGSFSPIVLGITGYDKQQAAYFIEDPQLEKGIFVESVQAGGGADKAGLQAGDVITALNDTEVNTMLKMKEILYALKPGDKVKVTYLRGGGVNTTEVTVSAATN